MTTYRKQFLYHTALLTASSLLLRCIGALFQVWLAGRIGSAGIGLYQLMGSVGALAMTFALSGVGFGTLRLVSEQLGTGSTKAAGAAVNRCLIYALCFGCTAGWVLYTYAEPIGFLAIEDGRTVLPLRIMAGQLPCMAMSAVFSGYFTACGRLAKPTLLQVAQQLCTIALTVWLLARVPEADIAQNCACITLAGTLSEMAGFTGFALLYLGDRLTHPREGSVPESLTPRLLQISLPLAVSAYARQGLSTIQHMLTPSGLRKAGLTAAGALSAYGIVHGMTLTVIYFPTCVLYVVAQLLVPRLTRLQVQQSREAIERICAKMLTAAMAFSLTAVVLLFVCADVIAVYVFKTEQVADYIRIFVPLIPVIYLDIIVDGCLKGLGRQLWSMGINIAESSISVVLTYLLVPEFAVAGFIAVVYFNEIFNFALSFWKLKQVIEND